MEEQGNLSYWLISLNASYTDDRQTDRQTDTRQTDEQRHVLLICTSISAQFTTQ